MVAHPKKMNAGTLLNNMTAVLERAGLRQPEQEMPNEKNSRGKIRKEVSRFNGFRKFFNTNLVRAKVNPQIKERLMDHSIQLDKNYQKPTAEERLQEYCKAINLLTINEENRLRIQLQEVTLRVDRLDQIGQKMKRLDDMLGLASSSPPSTSSPFSPCS